MGSIDTLSLGGDVELILLGTGTSSTLPHVDCLTRPPDAKPCRACISTLNPEGRKNKRGNTSAVARIRGNDGEYKTIVIDVGKSFLQSAVEWFPKYGLRRIDAVLVTHGHADAMNGLDDLRGWTLQGAIQPHVDVYLSQDTYEAVKIAFPYLVQKEFATGGGDVPEFRWHPWVSDRVPFEIGDTGILVKPFAVPHGFCGAKPPKPDSFVPTETAALLDTDSPFASGLPGSPVNTGIATPPNQKEEFLCFGFTLQDSVTYISDASRIPDHILDFIRSSHPPPYQLPVLVLDCLSLDSHRSHLSLRQSVDYARMINAQKTYLVGFSHSVAHDEYETMLKAVGGRHPPPEELTETVMKGLGTLDLNEEPICVRPGYDGLRIFVTKGRTRDSEYIDRVDGNNF
ncbi:beta-lactamase-like protein [Daedaleopsis nitida]|nr:beta-lactamase-like protein [Daedaleopsis nitida]